MTPLQFIVSFTAFILVYSLIMAVRSKNESIEDRIKRLSAQKESAVTKRRISWKEYLARLGRYTPRKWAEKIDRELHTSGIALTGGEFIILQLFLVILLFLVALALLQVSLVVIILPLLSIILPQLYISHRRNKKMRLFNNQLADVLLTLANSLKAGFSLFQAMEMASQEMPDPISSELRITLKEMTYGQSTETALLNFSKRLESKDLDLMITAILIQRQIGGNLAEILLNIHETIQQRLRIQGEVKTLTAQGRLSGYIIGALPIFIGLAITLIHPAYLAALFNSSLGLTMIAFGITLQFIGFIVIRKIINIKY
jgi:tight adherence protein B